MAYSKIFTNIYFRYTKYLYLNLLFYNKESQNALFYDGADFCYSFVANVNINSFDELSYSLNNGRGKIIIDSIRNDFDLAFVKFDNGDIFQIFFLSDDEKSPQQLGVFLVGDNLYRQTLDRFNLHEEYLVDQCDKNNKLDWALE